VIENGPASGASAIKTGFMAVASGLHDTVLVAGAERMREVNNLEATDFVATLTHPLAEYIYGVTLPAHAGMFTRLYMEKYGVTERHLAMVGVKNQNNAMLNPFAHLHQPITHGGHPRLAGGDDQQPVRRRAAAVLRLLPGLRRRGVRDPGEEVAGRRSTGRLIRLAGIGQATDTHAVHEREDPTDLLAVRRAAAQAIEDGRIKPQDVDVAELHDAFTILEIAESEEVGFFEKGEGPHRPREGRDPSAGRSRSTPPAGSRARATRWAPPVVAQAHEIVTQLRGEAEGAPGEGARIGLTCNFGGFGNNVVSLTFKREE
jgi:acetyl-CoA C-acetyltransferase